MTLTRLLLRWALHRSILIPVALFAGFIASGAASAKIFSVSGVCSGGGQLCNDIPTFPITVATGVVAKVRFIPGPLTCSDVRLHFLVDGTEVAVTGFVGPGGITGVVKLDLGPGKHTVGVQAEGEVGGCNVGTLLSWAGTIRVRKAP